MVNDIFPVSETSALPSHLQGPRGGTEAGIAMKCKLLCGTCSLRSRAAQAGGSSEVTESLLVHNFPQLALPTYPEVSSQLRAPS